MQNPFDKVVVNDPDPPNNTTPRVYNVNKALLYYKEHPEAIVNEMVAQSIGHNINPRI